MSKEAALLALTRFGTLDTRAVFKAVLRDHMGVSAKALDGAVFPDSAAIRPLEGVVRG